MDRIKLANGASYECTFCTAIPGTAFIAIPGSDFVRAAQIFGAAENTSRMEYGNAVLSGFTNLVDISAQPYGTQVTLKGGTITEA